MIFIKEYKSKFFDWDITEITCGKTGLILITEKANENNSRPDAINYIVQDDERRYAVMPEIFEIMKQLILRLN